MSHHGTAVSSPSRSTRAVAVCALLALLACTACLQEIVCGISGGHWNLAEMRCEPRPFGKSSVAAGPGTPLLIGAAAHVPGALGTNWRSDVEVHSLGDEVAAFTLSLLEHGEDNGDPATRELSLAPGESLRLGDVLAAEFGFEGQAALLVTPTAGRIAVSSRTYNLLGAGNDLGLPAGATFGQFIPAVPLGAALGAGEEGRIVQLQHDAAFRTNLALVNASAVECRIEADLHAADGTRLGTISPTLAPREYRQINRVFERATSDPVDDGYAVVRTSDACSFHAFASVVDNLTGDPVAVNAVRPDDVLPRTPAYVVASAHVPGAAGTNWRTDVQVHNPGAGTVGFTIELLAHGADNTAPESRQFTLGPGLSRRFADVLDTVFGLEGQAALRITPSDGRLIVTSRTYNLLGAGNDLGLPAGATFGQFIPSIPASEAIGFGGEGRLIQLAQDPAGGGFRTNLVLVSGSPAAVDVEADLYAADGASLGKVTRRLAPFEYRQLNRVFEQVTGEAVADGYAIVRTTTPGGRLYALASVVDNLTGDPVGMAAPEILAPAAEEVVGGFESVLSALGDVGIESVVDRLQLVGVGAVLDGIADTDPDHRQRIPGGVVIDYGTGVLLGNGMLVEGALTLDASTLTVTEQAIAGTVAVTSDGLRSNGEPVPIGAAAATFDLARRADRSVVGTITLGPARAAKDSGAIVGEISIDTSVCPWFPIGGSVTLDLAVLVLTLNFSDDCDGGVDHAIEPISAFSYSYANPAAAGADDYIVSTTNAEVAQEGAVWYWRPMAGAETLADTTPGVIIYHVPLAGPILGGRLRATLACFHWTYSQGSAVLYGSTDGVTWQVLDAVETPPDVGEVTTGGWNGDLPDLFLGARDVWLRVELLSWGPNAPIGGIMVNTAQHSRWAEGGTNPVFELEVTLGE